MVQLTTDQRTFVVRTYHLTRSYIAVRNAFRVRFGRRRNPPTNKCIRDNVLKYAREGTSLNLNRGRSGRPRSGRSQENIDLVRAAIEENPRISSRRNDTGIPHSTFNNITRLDLNLYPYHIHIQHQLLPADYNRRLEFSQWFVAKCIRDAQFLPFLTIGDEAGFYMNGTNYAKNIGWSTALLQKCIEDASCVWTGTEVTWKGLPLKTLKVRMLKITKIILLISVITVCHNLGDSTRAVFFQTLD